MHNTSYKIFLVTYDGSDLSYAAIPHAAELARICNAKILLLQVVKTIVEESLSMGSPGSGIYSAALGNSLVERIKKNKLNAKKQLEKIQNELTSQGIKEVEISIKEGFAPDVILQYAKKEKCDLIIMSTHGRSGLVRALLGSVADYVVRNSVCPVLIVRSDIIK